jgi:hypothetical protein
MLTVMGDHGCRWIVIPAETVVFVVLVVPTGHEQDCGACSQGSRVELYVYYRVSLEVETHLCIHPMLSCDAWYGTPFEYK